MITWDSRTLYQFPLTGTCAISGAYETGRYFVQDNEPIFVGNGKAPEVVHDYVGFLTASGATNAFKRGYARSDRVADRLVTPGKAGKAGKKK